VQRDRTSVQLYSILYYAVTHTHTQAREKRSVLSLDLNTATESLITTLFGSEFQTAGAEHR